MCVSVKWTGGRHVTRTIDSSLIPSWWPFLQTQMETRDSWPLTCTTKSHQLLVVRGRRAPGLHQADGQLPIHTNTHLCTTLTLTHLLTQPESVYIHPFTYKTKIHTGQHTFLTQSCFHAQARIHRLMCTHTYTHTPPPLNNVLLYQWLKYSLSSVSFYSATSHTLSPALSYTLF